MSWLPRISVFGTSIAEDEWEAEGRTLQIRWRSLVVEFCLARIDRIFPADDGMSANDAGPADD